MQIRRDQHETEVRFRRHHAKGEQLRRFHCAHFLHERCKIRFRGVLFVATEQLPLSVFDPVKQMQTMPAFFGNESRVLVGHRVSFIFEKSRSRVAHASRVLYPDDRSSATPLCARGKCALHYSSPSRETRNSRFGSLNSVAPQTAHLCNGSVSLRDSRAKRLRRAETSPRCRAS